jgi:uncharacterized membrane-anchored protein
MTARSKMPQWDGLERSQYQYLETLGRRQETVAQLEDLSSTATDAEIIAKINAILAAYRTN